jgi:hypothetical protein
MEVHSDVTCYTDMKMKCVIVPVYAVKALEWCAWSASHPSNLTPGRKKPHFQFNRRLGGHQSLSGCFGKEKNLLPRWEFNRDSLEVQPIA